MYAVQVRLRNSWNMRCSTEVPVDDSVARPPLALGMPDTSALSHARGEGTPPMASAESDVGTRTRAPASAHEIMLLDFLTAGSTPQITAQPAHFASTRVLIRDCVHKGLPSSSREDIIPDSPLR